MTSTPPTTSPAPPSSAWNDDLLKNPHAVADKRSRVQKMFAAIAPSYDLNNRLHSLWMDQAWRFKAVRVSDLKMTDSVVDVACGTGDLSLKFWHRLWRLRMLKQKTATPLPPSSSSDAIDAELLSFVPDHGQVIGIDFTFEMLPIAKSKSTIHDRQSTIEYINGDAQTLPLPDASADVVSIAFGIRNVQEPLVALKEFRRVLRPGGRVIVLEFSLPTNPILRGLYNFYFRQILPRTATLISGDKTGAYKYLPESVNTFISRDIMMSMMREAGFSQVEQFPMTFGVCICYRGVVAS